MFTFSNSIVGVPFLKIRNLESEMNKACFFVAQNDETGEVERLMGKIDLPERTWVSPAESEDWDQGVLLI